MKKWLLRITAALVTAIMIMALLVFLTLRASLPLLDGTVTVAGLASAATIERDAYGIATITASTRDDLAYATGFAHAHDRFFQMDLMRRQSAGELSALLGSMTVDFDRRVRLHRFRARAGLAVTQLREDDVHLLERYADGVNEGLARLGAKPFE
jgi:penicillin amidase